MLHLSCHVVVQMFPRHRSPTAVAAAHFQHGAIFAPMLPHGPFGDPPIATFWARNVSALAFFLEALTSLHTTNTASRNASKCPRIIVLSKV